MAIATIDPRTGETRSVFEALDETSIDRKLDLSVRAFERWRRTSFAERAAALGRAAAILDAEKRALGRLMTEEMGKTLRAAIAEAEKCATACRHYAAHAESYLADQPVATEAASSYVRHLPLGPVLAVMPWNFPFWQVFRFAAPTLM